MPNKWQTQERAKAKMAPPGQLGAGDYGALPDIKIPHAAVTDPNMSDGALPKDTAHATKPGAGLADPAMAGNPVMTDVPPMPGPAVKKSLADLIRKSPDYRIPGQGVTKPGESFNEFRVRALSAVRGIMQALAEDPIQAIAVPKHSQVSKLVEAWVANGMPDDLSIDSKAMMKDTAPKPGEVERFYPVADGSWKIEKFDPAMATSLPKGSIYFVEHGQTPATAGSSTQVSSGQKARAEIVSAIRDGNWKGAQKAAQKASSAKLLSDDEISEAIDEAIPDAEEASQLPPHHLLSMASAASPAKRSGLMPVVKQAFGEMSGASPEAAQALRSHLGRLG